ncbi:exosome complex component RRP45A-like isoform X4 [Musa acuminata AAA Group]|uniref:exosome complex component RRP45A-like isoform X4 n=1 Tax=Musa acuminata AAA Group TaxID=214697 RepID=UPI0031D3C9BE
MEQRLANTWRMTNNEKKFIASVLASDLRVDGRRPFDYRDLTIKFGRHVFLSPPYPALILVPFSWRFIHSSSVLPVLRREQGLSEVQLGQTRVMSYVTSQLVQPYRDRPNEGTLSIFTEFSPMADPSFEAGRPGELAVELGRVIDRGLRESSAMDMESLCVVVGKSVWSIRVDLHIVDNGGNLIDAANIAALVALLTFRRPDCTLGGDDGQELIMHDAEVREPLPLIIHHLPIAVTFAVFGEGNIMVIDPTHKEEMVMGGRMTFTMNSNGDICAVQKAGGVGVMSSLIMQCLQIASAKAADITSKIKHAVEIYNTERASQKANHYLLEVANQVSLSDVIMKEKQVENLIEHLAYMPLDELENSNQGDALAVDTRTKHESISQGRYTRAFVRGPANWDPYSRGISSRLATSFPTLPDAQVNSFNQLVQFLKTGGKREI